MKKLKVADTLSLPLESVTQTFGILAKKGSGKSYTASVLAEEMLGAGQQVIVIDPTGAWWGLRSSADGKSAGFPVVVFGGDHADLPLETTAGEVLALAAVEHRFSAVLDLSLMRKGESRRFVADFLETLYRKNRDAMHLIVDEADAYAPQAVRGEDARSLGAMEDVVRRGRKRGIGCTMITQRPQALAKDVLTQVDSLFVMRMNHPRDIGAIREWVGVHASNEDADKVIDSLPSLATGAAWFWSPGWMDALIRIKVRLRTTFDSGATPKPGERQIAPKAMAAVDLKRLGSQLQESLAAAVQNDPKVLRKRIEALQQAVKEQQGKPAEIKRVDVPIITDGQISELNRLIDHFTEFSGRLIEAVTCISEAIRKTPGVAKRREGFGKPVQTKPRLRDAIEEAEKPQPKYTIVEYPVDVIGSGGKRRIMTALAQYPDGVDKTRLSILTDISPGGGTFRTYIAELKSNDFLTCQNGLYKITPEGRQRLGKFDPLPTGAALRQYWFERLGNGGQRSILQELCGCYPQPMMRDEVARRTGIAIGGGTWRTYVAKLKGLRLIDGKADLRASDDLFRE